MIEALGLPHEKKGMPVVLDAGIATVKNLAWLNENEYGYIVCHRGKASRYPTTETADAAPETIQSKSATDTQIRVILYEVEGDTYLKCKSENRDLKETGLLLPMRTKILTRVLEILGRLKERYPSISQMYEFVVLPEPGKEITDLSLKAIDVQWTQKQPAYQKAIESEGEYILRTNRSALSTTEIWNTYISLGRVETAFRNMKSHLGFRPVFYQCEARTDAHLFISVVAYHLL